MYHKKNPRNYFRIYTQNGSGLRPGFAPNFASIAETLHNLQVDMAYLYEMIKTIPTRHHNTTRTKMKDINANPHNFVSTNNEETGNISYQTGGLHIATLKRQNKSVKQEEDKNHMGRWSTTSLEITLNYWDGQKVLHIVTLYKTNSANTG